MLSKFLNCLFPQKPDCVTVKVIQSDTGSLFVRLFVNDRSCAQMKCLAETETVILIGDVLHINKGADYNKGYGTVMMEKLLDYARKHGVSYIYGNLSDVDLDHKDRLHHFYRKFGFIITEYPEMQEGYYGKIELHL